MPIPSDAACRESTSEARPPVGLRSAEDERLARATLARFIAEVFAADDAHRLARLGESSIRNEVRRAAGHLKLPAGTIHVLWDRLHARDAILEERNRLFGHTVRSSCPPYELEYGRSEVFQQSQSLADIAGFYAAFDCAPGGDLAERPDHLVSEWEFLSVLAIRQVHFEKQHNTDAREVCRQAQRAFLQDHVACWMIAFCNRIRQAEPGGFFACVAELVEAVVRESCQALGVTTGPSWIELRPVTEDDSTMTCGAPGESRVELGPRLAAGFDTRHITEPVA